MLTVGNVSDESMALAYSAMDLTFSIDRGAGFNYPAFESIFCETPCFATSYGAHVEYMDEDHVIRPNSFRIEGPMNLLRPVHWPMTWVEWIELREKLVMEYPDGKAVPVELDWVNLWPKFQEWFREGVNLRL